MSLKGSLFHGYDLFLILQIYNENEILQTKLNILNKTNMVDYILEIRQQLNISEEESEVCFINKLILSLVACVWL